MKNLHELKKEIEEEFEKHWKAGNWSPELMALKEANKRFLSQSIDRVVEEMEKVAVLVIQ